MSDAVARGWTLHGVTGVRRSRAAQGSVVAVPLVAVLCRPPRERAAAAGIALALSRAMGASCALASVAGSGPAQSLGASPAARRAAAALSAWNLPGVACGRLVWLPDRREVGAAGDVAVGAAALSAELGRAAAAAGAPGAVALPYVRTAALDRVLAWHDAIVVVREPDTSEPILQRVLSSLAALGRPVAEMTPPPRLAATLALAGLRVPSEAAGAVARLGLTGRSRD